MYNVVIRADNSSEIGMGHFVRSTALASKFAELGNNVFLLTSRKSVIPDYANEAYKKVFFVDEEWDLINEKPIYQRIMGVEGIDLLVIDTYKASKEYYLAVKDYTKMLVVFDDIGEKRDIPANIIINGNVYAQKLEYDMESDRKLLLLGSKYLIMRYEFKTVKPRLLSDKVRKFLITFGGSDVCNATPAILKTICANKELFKDIEIFCMIGPGYQNKNDIEQISSEEDNINLLYNPGNVAELFSQMDMAVSAAGSSSYELAVLGIPSLLYTVADNQKMVAAEMQTIGISIDGGLFASFNDEDFIENCGQLINNYEKRKQMHQKALDNFDAYGSDRCVEKMVKDVGYSNNF